MSEKKVYVRMIRPGAVKVGNYKAGEIYEVDENEANRLVRVKGFEVVSGTAAIENKAGE